MRPKIEMVNSETERSSHGASKRDRAAKAIGSFSFAPASFVHVANACAAGSHASVVFHEPASVGM